MSKQSMEYNLEESFGYLTGHAYRAINNRLKNLFVEQGHPITVEQFGVMVHLWEEDNRCQNEIAQILDKDKPSISRLVGHLEKKQLLERKKDKHDSRKKKLVLTESGKDLEHSSKSLAYKVYQECIIGLSAEEIDLTKKLLRKIKDTIIHKSH